jgi:hypothetical protein
MNINFNNRKFVVLENSENGEVSSKTVFSYYQTGKIIFGNYEGGIIIKGQILGKMMVNGHLSLVYQHLNIKGELLTGKCTTIPSVSENGKIILNESWQWTTQNKTKGYSMLTEL